MNKILFSEAAWEDYLYWQTQDKKTLRRINQLLRDILRDPFAGIGKPEPLKGELSGYWSRRSVYQAKENGVDVLQCRGHDS